MSEYNHNPSENIRIAFFLNLSFTVIELIGGFFTNSVAIMSDAIHDLGDSFSFGIAWTLESYSDKKNTKLFSYGYKRFSLLGALINGLILVTSSIFILIESIKRVSQPEITNSYGMLVLAVLGIIVNGLAVYKTNHGKNMNEKVISLHLLEDVLGWCAVLIASIVMIFTNWYLIDPLLSILITIYILWGVKKNLTKTFILFLQSTPEKLDTETVNEKININPLVLGVHDTHIWSLDGENNILSSHIVIDKTSTSDKIKDLKNQIKEQLRSIGIQHATIEIEFEDEICFDTCS